MYKNEIFLDAPNLGELEKKYLNKAIDSGFVSTAGDFVPEFEKKFARYLGTNKAVAVQSGTASLHIALYELGIGQKDEVIVPALTFVATVNPVAYVGAKPIFVDVDIETWNIDHEKIEEAITDKTKAIIPVHLFGNPCNMDAILKIAKKHNLFVIEDATESLGAKYRNYYTGTFGDFGCFSFNGNKLITTGGGGMVIGQDADKLEHIKFLVNQARDNERGYYHPEIGFNYRMTNIEAAIGLAQMEKLDEFLVKKKLFNQIYKDELGKINEVIFQKELSSAKSSWWLTSIIFKKEININGLQKELKKNKIPTRRVFMPIIEFPPYKNFKKSNYLNSYYIYKHSLCLPSSTLNKEDDIYFICKTIKKILQ
ncbi:LegC family aminotransferase [Desulfohalobiaceae bacterium Ax17]|uniref:LegC family aminotransferase n=1 Tax=Desulfovulcanus ferrireducens TaxID=2831190 RepID=UPI00207BC723|nr:LegC family aminotransferase [Desulfovulcanus ferrireducens]MBT8763522.1 LegC family aminotransferase [Desulfovulcanus ferrireducens]